MPESIVPDECIHPAPEGIGVTPMAEPRRGPPFAPLDREGRAIRPGQLVRIVGTPELGEMSAEARRESAPVFEHLVGTYRRVRAVTEIGLVELSFRIAAGPHAGLHVVWLEPRLVRIRQPGGRRRS